MQHTKQQPSIYRDSLPPLDRKVERGYLHLAKFSPNPVVKQKAREILIRSNLRFLCGMAIRWAAVHNLEAEDLAAEGRMGLLKAIDKYDMEKSEVRFLSFAAWDIRHAFQEVQRLDALVRGSHRSNLSSLDEEISGSEEGEPLTLRDVLEDDKNTHRAVQGEDRGNAQRKVAKLVTYLSVSEKDIICKRFGLGDQDVLPMDTQQIADLNGIPFKTISGALRRALVSMRARA